MSTGKKGSGIWTPANVVTCIRIACVPVWLFVAELIPAAKTSFSAAALGAALFYMLISLTDKLDGYLARSRNEVTTFGKFLDPIADKLVVLVALAFLLEEGMTSSWVLFIVVTRATLESGRPRPPWWPFPACCSCAASRRPACSTPSCSASPICS